MEAPWSPEDEAKARRLCQEIVDRGMAWPAILFLEGLRPLHFVGGQFLHFMSPMTGILAPRWNLDRAGNFLEHRDAVPFMIREIERLDAARRARRRS